MYVGAKYGHFIFFYIILLMAIVHGFVKWVPR